MKGSPTIKSNKDKIIIKIMRKMKDIILKKNNKEEIINMNNQDIKFIEMIKKIVINIDNNITNKEKKERIHMIQSITMKLIAIHLLTDNLNQTNLGKRAENGSNSKIFQQKRIESKELKEREVKNMNRN